MRVSSILLAAGLSLSLMACSGAKEGFVPPKAGTQLIWKYVYEGGSDDDVVTVVATGPDFAIFRQTLDTTYFAEFSGIGFATCNDEEQPSREDRQAALSAWPLEVGTEIAWQNDKVTVDREDTYDLSSEKEPVVWITHDYADEDSENDNFAISPRYGTALELLWPENGRDFVVSIGSVPIDAKEVQPGYFLLEGVDLSDLGFCASLLSEEEPVTAAEN